MASLITVIYVMLTGRQESLAKSGQTERFDYGQKSNI